MALGTHSPSRGRKRGAPDSEPMHPLEQWLFGPPSQSEHGGWVEEKDNDARLGAQREAQEHLEALMAEAPQAFVSPPPEAWLYRAFRRIKARSLVDGGGGGVHGVRPRRGRRHVPAVPFPSSSPAPRELLAKRTMFLCFFLLRKRIVTAGSLGVLAARCGYTPILEFLFRRTADGGAQAATAPDVATFWMLEALRSGQPSTAQWARKRGGKLDADALVVAAAAPGPAALEWVVDTLGFVYPHARSPDSKSALQQLKRASPAVPPAVGKAVFAAIRERRPATLRWLFSQGERVTPLAVQEALAYGSADVVGLVLGSRVPGSPKITEKHLYAVLEGVGAGWYFERPDYYCHGDGERYGSGGGGGAATAALATPRNRHQLGPTLGPSDAEWRRRLLVATELAANAPRAVDNGCLRRILSATPNGAHALVYSARAFWSAWLDSLRASSPDEGSFHDALIHVLSLPLVVMLVGQGRASWLPPALWTRCRRFHELVAQAPPAAWARVLRSDCTTLEDALRLVAAGAFSSPASGGTPCEQAEPLLRVTRLWPTTGRWGAPGPPPLSKRQLKMMMADSELEAADSWTAPGAAALWGWLFRTCGRRDDEEEEEVEEHEAVDDDDTTSTVILATPPREERSSLIPEGRLRTWGSPPRTLAASELDDAGPPPSKRARARTMSAVSMEEDKSNAGLFHEEAEASLDSLLSTT